MDNYIKPVRKWYRKKKWWVIGVAVLGIAIWVIFFRGGKEPAYEIIVTKKADLIQEVSVTGKVKPAQAVDLQFEAAGRIAYINYKVGNRVNSGVTIASLENQDLQAAVTSAKADLEKTIRNFNSLNDASVSSALRVELENARINLDQTVKKADGDMAADYTSSFNVMREAMTQIDTSSSVLEYIRKTYFEAKSGDDTIKQYQVLIAGEAKQVKIILPSLDQPGVIITPALYDQIDLASQELLSALQSLRSAFTYVQSQVQTNPSLVSATDRTTINSEAAAVSSDLSSVSSAIQAVADQKVTNEKSIADANAKLATAQAAFPTSEDILQKESALSSAQAQLRKSLIVAPFTGTIGKIDVERGQTVSSSVVIVSLISVANYQIEANITEIDISKIRLGNPAVLTLDAYGSQTILNAKVSAIDTAATIVEGVTTYKTIFDFEGSVDPGIRPNMTANLDIQTARKDSVISVPQRAVVSRNGDKFIRIFRDNNITPEERVVQLGMSGKDGYVEIISGLMEGESVITFINEQ